MTYYSGTLDNDILVGTLDEDLIEGLQGNDSLAGNAGDDELSGGEGNDTLNGGAGDDLLAGEAGDDFLMGEEGNDYLDGGEGNDTLNGGAGDDRLYGQAGEDLLITGSGNDSVYGGVGKDTLNGGEGRDLLSGEAGEDLLTGEAGNDHLDGGIDNDTLNGGDGNDRLFGVANEDILIGGAGNDTLSGGVGNDTLIGTRFNGALSGLRETDTLLGGAESDRFILGDVDWVAYDDGNAGTNGASNRAIVQDFNPGEDIIQLQGASNLYRLETVGSDSNLYLDKPEGETDELIAVIRGITELNLNSESFAYFNLAPVVDNPITDQTASEDNAFSYTIAENTFSDFGTLTYSATLENGDPLPTWLNFDSTTRTFSGTPGDENIGEISIRVTATDNAGATIQDVFKLTIESTNNVPTLANALSDRSAIETQPFSFIIPANTFVDIDAGDSLTYSATLADGSLLPSWLNFDTTSGTFNGTPGDSDSGIFDIKITARDRQGATVSDTFTLEVFNLINGTDTNDNLSGTSNSDVMIGSDGDDFLEGLAGNDTINGGLGSLDRLFGGSGNDTIVDSDGVNGAHGGDGNDTINVTFAATWDNDSNATNGPRSDGRISGGTGDDAITVRMNNNRFFINMRGDETTSNPFDGNDTIALLGSYQNSQVDLGGGNDLFNGGNGTDNVSGKAGNDTLIGGAGSDGLIGDSGDDLLTGGAGNDTLRGGAGQDRFIYNNLSEGSDTIRDFQVGEDKIVLTQLLDNLGYGGSDPISDSYVRAIAVTGGTGIQIDSDGTAGSNAFQTIALLENVVASTISASDFVF